MRRIDHLVEPGSKPKPGIALMTAALALSCWGCTLIADFPSSDSESTCGNGQCEATEDTMSCPRDCQVMTTQPVMSPLSHRPKVDVLFVIDNSFTMANEQQNLQTSFFEMLGELKSMPGGMPDLHIGVVTTDLGVGANTIQYCENNGDGGILGMVGSEDLAASCLGSGQRYFVDVEPSDCDIQKNAEGTCSNHTCDQSDCDGAAHGSESLTFYVDEDGCPRCRNFITAPTDAFACLADVGTEGCPFEQPLEAMYEALDVQGTPENDGFLRDNAFLAVILISDEDDCSASDPDTLFDPNDTSLGDLGSFRCFEYGVECDQEARQAGAHTNCAPRDDQDALLHPISRYTSLMESLKDPAMTVVAAIAGPVDEEILVELVDQFKLEPSCTDVNSEGAAPAVRIKAFVEQQNEAADIDAWAYTSICEADLSGPLDGIGGKLADEMAYPCPTGPLSGCPRGPDGTECAACLPNCNVVDVENRGTPNEQRMRVPWCGNVCQNGLCDEADMSPCDFDINGRCECPLGLAPTKLDYERHCAPLLYVDPPGSDVDPDLLSVIPRTEPSCTGDDCEGVASACWYVAHSEICSHGARLRIVRGQEPRPRTFTEVECAVVPDMESNCDDGKDDDEDCLVDGRDPDCM